MTIKDLVSLSMDGIIFEVVDVESVCCFGSKPTIMGYVSKNTLKGNPLQELVVECFRLLNKEKVRVWIRKGEEV